MQIVEVYPAACKTLYKQHGKTIMDEENTKTWRLSRNFQPSPAKDQQISKVGFHRSIVVIKFDSGQKALFLIENIEFRKRSLILLLQPIHLHTEATQQTVALNIWT